MKNFVKLCVVFLSVFLLAGWNSDERALKKEVEAANNRCPVRVDEITTLTSVEFINNDVVYTYQLSDSELSEIVMDKSLVPDKDVKDNVLTELRARNNADVQKFGDLCKKTKSNIVYRYKLGNRQREVTIGYDEL